MNKRVYFRKRCVKKKKKNTINNLVSNLERKVSIVRSVQELEY